MKLFVLIGAVVLVFASAAAIAATPEEDARFLKAVRSAYMTKDKDGIIALTCWDRVPANLKKLAPKVLDQALSSKVKSVEYADFDPSSPMRITQGAVVYGPNLAITKAIEIEYEPGDDGDSRRSSIFVGEKDGKLMIANLAPLPDNDPALKSPYNFKIGGPESWMAAPDTLTSNAVGKVEASTLNQWVRERPPFAFLLPRATDTDNGANPWVKVFVAGDFHGSPVDFLKAARDTEKKTLPGYKVEQDVSETSVNSEQAAAYTCSFAPKGAEGAEQSTLLRICAIRRGSFLYIIAISSPLHPPLELERDFATIISSFRFTN